MILAVIGHTFHYEMECVLRLFFPREKLEVIQQPPQTAGDVVITGEQPLEGQIRLYVSVQLGGAVQEREQLVSVNMACSDRELVLARLLYAALCRVTGQQPPWGVLTGVRPVRLCRNLREMMLDEQAKATLREKYLVGERKADCLVRICDIQKKWLSGMQPREFSLYVSIPFCPSRCLYCSFVSHDIKGAAKRIPAYIVLLCEELRQTGRIAARLGWTLRSIYIGGGTPTSLEAEQLGRVMQTIRESFDLSALAEYTVEAGRPDTITPEKLRVIRELGADRVSINPQTMNDDILRLIGRAHTAQQTRDAYHMAREAGFPVINMDLIAGLPGDDGNIFCRTLQEVLAMGPENITLHTLTVKRSSRLRESGGEVNTVQGLGELLDEANETICSEGYQPYYLYRQKGTVGNLENIGYARPGTESLYNIWIMEEVQTILAVGAGAVTKICRDGQPLQRVFNYKFPQEYIDGFEEILSRKAQTERIMEATP